MSAARPSKLSRSITHIVLIVLDTVRADHLDLYGYERETMPRLTEWSNRALVANRAVAPSSQIRQHVMKGERPNAPDTGSTGGED